MVRLNRPCCPYPTALESGNYKHPRNKEALKKASHDKCMYCESKISHIDFAHVEHIKPKADDKYPELEFVWENHGYACPKCNNAKSDSFDETTPYIDPYSEDPKEHLYAFGSFIWAKNGSERGDLTIQDIELNRPELLEKRMAKITEINNTLNACFRTQNPRLRESALAELKKEAEVDKEYSMVVEALLEASLRDVA